MVFDRNTDNGMTSRFLCSLTIINLYNPIKGSNNSHEIAFHFLLRKIKQQMKSYYEKFK